MKSWIVADCCEHKSYDLEAQAFLVGRYLRAPMADTISVTQTLSQPKRDPILRPAAGSGRIPMPIDHSSVIFANVAA